MDYYGIPCHNNSKVPICAYKQQDSKKNWTLYKAEQLKGNHMFFTGMFLYKKNTNVKFNHDNGIIVLDIDYTHRKHAGKKNDFVDKFGDINSLIKMCNTYTVNTAGGGYHFYFLYDEDLSKTHIDIKDKDGKSTHVDLLSNNSLCVGVQTTRDGKTYKVVQNKKITKMPKKIKQYIKDYEQRTKPKLKITKKKVIKNDEVVHRQGDWCYHFTDDFKKAIVNAVPIKKHLDKYEMWFKFTTFCKVIGAQELWDERSKKAKGYDRSNNIDIWNGISSTQMVGIVPHFLKFLKIDDEKAEEFAPYFKYVPTQNLNKKKPHKRINTKKLGYTFLDDYAGDVVIKSDTGTGKTTTFKHHIKKHKKPFISIVSRKSLAYAQYKTFAEHGLDVIIYENVGGIFEDGKNYIVQIDSIMKALKLTHSNYTLFLDEYNSLIDYMTLSTTLNAKRTNVFDLFTKMVTQCDRVVAVDADTSNICFDMLDHCNREYKYIYNGYLHNQNVKAIEITNYDVLKEKLKTTKKWLLCCDSKAEADAMKQWLLDHGVTCVVYTSDEKDTIIDLDADERVIYSPKILYGLDSSMKRDVFTLYTSKTINPSNMKQQIARCRNITTLYFHFVNKHLEGRRKPPTLQQFMTDKYMMEQLIISEFEVLVSEQMRELYFKLLVTCEYRDECFASNKYLHFKLMLSRYGFIVEEPNVLKIMRDHDKKAKKLSMEKAKEARFEGVDLYKHQLNQYLSIPKDKIDLYKDVFKSPTLVTNHFNVCRYFFDEQEKLIEKLVSKTEFNAKNVSSNVYKINKLRNIAKICGFDNDFVIRNDVPMDKRNEITEYYRKNFRDRSSTALTMEKAVQKMINKLLGDVVKCVKKNVTINGVRTSRNVHLIDVEKMAFHKKLYGFRQSYEVDEDGNPTAV